MKTTEETISLQVREHGLNWTALIALLLFWCAHVAGTWRESTVWYGDYGRWLHEIDRFAHGEVFYRDFYWAFPPLGMWVFGSFARIFGAQLDVIRVATVLLSLLIYLGFFFYVTRLLPNDLVLGTVIGGFLLSSGYAQVLSLPLPMGMYTPAAPLGFLFLLFALLLVLRSWDRWRAFDASLAGVFCGLCILTKQDFWLPALYLVVASLLPSGERHRPLVKRLYTPAAFLLTVLVGVLVVAQSAGWKTVTRIPGGFGQVAEFGGRGLPTWERLTTEIAALGMLSAAVFFCLRISRAVSFVQVQKWLICALVLVLLAAAVHMGMSLYFGHQLNGRAFPRFASPTEDFLLTGPIETKWQLLHQSWSWLKFRLQLHLFPVLLPVVMLLVIAFSAKAKKGEAWTVVMFLLGLCVVCRARRLFEYTEWYNFLLEIPVYLLAIKLLFPLDSRRKVQVGLQFILVGLALAGAYSYWFFGVGNFTRAGVGRLLVTPRGAVRVASYLVPGYQQLNRVLDGIDPEHKKPLFAFGYTGGFNYFLNRKNPSPLTLGFRLSNFPSQKVMADLRNSIPGLILIDNPIMMRPIPAPSIDLSRWDQKMWPSPYNRVDRPLFDQLMAGCEKLSDVATFAIYNCNQHRE